MDNTPLAYKKGYAEFYKLRFKVTPDVLIPRPETELLVDEVLGFVHSPITILDLGTGSGAIAISIAKNAADVKIIATDISQKTLEIAKQNARLHKVEGKIKFIHSDLLSNIGCWIFHPDIIVTNLPYIPTARIPYLDSSVKDFEPWVALDGGEDGFKLYRKLFQQINQFSLPPRRWKPKLVIGEIDYTHGELAVLEAQRCFPKAQIQVKKDLAHKQRILIINFPSQEVPVR